MDWQIETLAPAFIQRARREGVDALGQPVRRLAARGGEPLRDALRRARPGEALILASYSPFRLDGPYREFGPVFLAAEPQAESLPSLDVLLAGPGYFRDAPALRAYDAGQSMLEAALRPGTNWPSGCGNGRRAPTSLSPCCAFPPTAATRCG